MSVAPEQELAAAPAEILGRDAIVVGLESVDRDTAIDVVGRMLLDRGVISEGYLAGMHDREATMSTFLGNGVAMPHGTFDTKSAVLGTGIVVAQYPDGIEWGDSGTVHLVIGLAAEGDGHVQILSQLAEVLQDEELCAELWTTSDVDRLHAVLNEAPDDDDDDEPMPATRRISIANDAGLHARPATAIVELVKAFDGTVTVAKGDKVVKAGSIMAVLSLGAVDGDDVTFSVEDGDGDATGLLDRIEEILTTREGA